MTCSVARRRALRAPRFLCFLFALAACAVSDEGASDFRTVAADGGFRKNVPPTGDPGRQIERGQPLLVTLKSAYIKDFTELFGNPLTGLSGPNGEIVIVANVFEDDGATALDFGPTGLQNARVVFFSDDVQKGQFLNFHGLPLYGPLTYRGFPVVLDLYVLDLDRPGPQLRQMLANLAKIGTVAYPPGTPIAGALAQLAGTLISDDQDDKAYHFTLVQRPAGGAADVPFSVIEAGPVVFVREQAREKATDWPALAFNSEAGLLVYRNPAGVAAGACLASPSPPPTCLYRENTYLVVEVNTAPTALQNDRQRVLFSALRSDLAGRSPATAREDAPQAAVDALAQRLAQVERADRASRALDVIEDASRPAAERRAAAAEFAGAWFAEGGALSAEHEERLLRRAGRRLATCGADTGTLIELTEALRGYQRTEPQRGRIADLLACADRG